MEEYISTIESAMPAAQAAALNTFISRAEKENYAIDSSLEPTGEKLFSVPDNPTNSTQYNTAISTAITDVHTLFTGLDEASSMLSSINLLNRSSLNQVQVEVEKLESVLDSITRLIPTSTAYTHVLHQDFITNNGDIAYLPEDLPRLTVDPEMSALVRPITLDISRIPSTSGNPMCKVSVESMLGTSAEVQHPVDEAIDGSISTFWREVIHSDVPIASNKTAVPWLKHTNYEGGAAVRVRFDFEALTPISEICIKPLADYPIEVLNVSWSTDTLEEKAQGGTVDVDGTFDTWPDSSWATSTTGIITATNPAEGQDGTKCLKLAFDGAPASRYVIKHTAAGLKPGGVYSLSFSARSSSGKGLITAQVVSNNGKAVLFRHTPEIGKKWTRYNYLITMPTAFSDIPTLEIHFYDTDIIWFDNLQINADSMSIMPRAVQTARDSITLPLSHNYGKPIMCRTLWLTLVQKNYTLQHYSIPKSQLDAESLLYDTSNDGWDSHSSPWRRKDDLLPSGSTSNSPLASAAKRMGGKVKSMLAKLMRLSRNTDDEMVSLTKYEYIIGAREIDLRYKDYGPSGYWISKPLNLRGEIRQMTVVPNTGPVDQESIKMYLLPREDSAVDVSNAYCLNDNHTVYFRSSTESGKVASGVDMDADNVITLQPRSPRKTGISSTIKNGKEIFRGTDRSRKVQLSSHPYFNTEQAWKLHTRVTDGVMNATNRYDPNASSLTYLNADSLIATTPGYRPVSVTLRTPDQVIPPDIIGRSPYTKFTIQTDVVLTEVTDATTLTEVHETQLSSSGKIQRNIPTIQTKSTATEQNVRKVRVFKTSKPISYIAGVGAKLAVYFTSSDNSRKLLDPSKYTVRWEKQVGNLNSPGSVYEPKSETYADTIEIVTDPRYDKPDYNYAAVYRTETTATPLVHDIEDYAYVGEDGNTSESSITDFSLQSYPVTRNVTDYLTGKVPTLKQAVLDRTQPDYYPVYEYYIDTSGNIVFANDLFEYGDNPAIIEVEYLTLDINPRILISYEPPEIGTSTCATPMLTDYTILLNARS